MRLAWVTDIHLNFVRRPALRDFVQEVNDAGPDAVLVGGDVAEADSVCERLEELRTLLDRPVHFVLGNHDFYGGAIADVRRRARELAFAPGGPIHLPNAGVVPLTAKTALVGHDGWGDARLGNHDASPIILNDFLLIEELAAELPDLRRRGALTPASRARLLTVLRRLGDEAGAHFQQFLPDALRDFENVVVLTHVPPFRESCWHDGRISDDDWLPYFSCAAAGAAILAAVADRPDRQVTVLCGHTHGAGECEPLPNLRVLTAGAVYGQPRLQRILEAA